MTPFSCDPFFFLGVDHFYSDFSRTKKYLPKDYNLGDEFKASVHQNELFKFVQSAEFNNLKSGIQALAATIAVRKSAFLSHCNSLGYTTKFGSPNTDQTHFWIYVYFQGEGRAKKYLESNAGYDFSNAAP